MAAVKPRDWSCQKVLVDENVLPIPKPFLLPTFLSLMNEFFRDTV
jgi:hypothetical protein